MNLPEPAYPEHPRAAVGAVVIKDDKVLLVRRGRPPASGQWAIPGGNIKLGETLQQAAEREILEETGIVIRAGDPIYTFDAIVRDEGGVIQFHYVIVDLVAEYIDGSPRPGDDADDVRWLNAEAIGTLPVSPPTLKLLKETLHFL
jgi:ADP-ribose pyrophosphatase